MPVDDYRCTIISGESAQIVNQKISVLDHKIAARINISKYGAGEKFETIKEHVTKEPIPSWLENDSLSNELAFRADMN